MKGRETTDILSAFAKESGHPTSADELWQLLQMSMDIYWQEDTQFRCISSICTDPHSRLAVIQDMTGQTPWEYGLRPVDSDLSLAAHIASRQRHQPFSQLLCQFQTESGICFLLVNGHPSFDSHGNFTGYRCLGRDISQQQRNESSLKRFRAAMDMSGDMIYLVDRETLRFIDVNDTACRNSGLTREQLLSMSPEDVLSESREEIISRYDHIISKGGSSKIENNTFNRRGEPAVLEVYSRALLVDKRWIIIGVTRDVTARKMAEEAALRLQQMFSALSASNESILRAKTVEALFENVCNAAVTNSKFSIASILMAGEKGWLYPVAEAGNVSPHINAFQISADKGKKEGMGISGTAFREERACISNDFQNDERTEPWHDLARQQSISSGAAFPLFQRRKCVAVMLFFSPEKHAFDDEIAKLLMGMAENISYALESFASEEDRKKTAKILQESEERFRSLTHLSSDFYWEQDASFRFVKYEGKVSGESNQRAVDQLIGNHLWDSERITPDSYSWDQLKHQLKKQSKFRDFEFSFINDLEERYHFSLSGEPIFDEQGNFKGYRGIAKDVSERKRASEHIKFLATHDNLTGLPNRVMFSELLEQAVRSAKRYPDESFAVLFIDLDRFKTINDTFGHHIGDTLLMEVAGRLKKPLRESDVVARLGGDEFVILLQHVSERNQIEKVAGNLLASLGTDMDIHGRHCQISCSIGISIFGDDAGDEPTLMQHADAAMYVAKEEGKNNYQFYSREIHERNHERNTLEIHLQQALPKNQFDLHYQAKLDLLTGRICGVEALLRWHSPELGNIGPDRFIPVAEDTGQIVEIGEWVLSRACIQMMEWSTQHDISPMNLAVNISARQFNDPGLIPKISRALESSGLPAEFLELEITEGMLIHHPERAFQAMEKIKALGVKLAIDDFGTGYSSLSQLKNYPIDTLKIDRSFIKDIPENLEDRAIAKAIISMGNTLGLKVIAEGVELSEQMTFLQEHFCDQVQGYFFHRPAPGDEFVQWYKSHEPESFRTD